MLEKTTTKQTDIFDNVRYICQSCTLITDSLKKGADVLQMANGDIMITEVKPFTYYYEWSDEKGKFVRAKSDRKIKKPRKNAKANKVAEAHSIEDEDLFDFVD